MLGQSEVSKAINLINHNKNNNKIIKVKEGLSEVKNLMEVDNINKEFREMMTNIQKSLQKLLSQFIIMKEMKKMNGLLWLSNIL